MPSSRLSRLAASSKRASAANHGFVSCSAESRVAIGKTSGSYYDIGWRSLTARDPLHRPLDLPIPLRFNFIALLHTQRLIENLSLQAVADEVEFARPLGYTRLYVAIGQVNVEIVQQRGS